MNFSRIFSLRARDVQAYRVCEDFTEGLIYPMVVFSPWAFGTTQSWSIWTMNIAGYVLGVLTVVKWFIRDVKGYPAGRWGKNSASGTTKLLLIATAAILAYCFTSALNAYATYHRSGLGFEYHSCVRWLPHTFDSNLTWPLCWSYLGLAGSFWAIRDWLMGKTAAEERAAFLKGGGEADAIAELLPGRLRRLLWVLAVNGGLLAVEGIVQRLEGSGQLLFLVKPRVNQDALSQFGPYAYRANAAQYFNLLWPVCVGFWWMLHRARGFRRSEHHAVLLCAALMAACPIISTSRGGAIITAGILALGTFFLVASHFLFPARRGETRRAKIFTAGIVIVFCASALALGYFLGWKSLQPRMAQIEEGYEGREEMYAAARPMAADYPLFGTGPGTFETVFQLYRESTATYWPVQLHNDWLETRITFGGVGSGLIALAFLTVLSRWFVRGGIYSGRRFIILLWLALAGCLVHARYDFPFQIHSIVFLFLLWCAVLSNLSRKPG